MHPSSGMTAAASTPITTTADRLPLVTQLSLINDYIQKNKIKIEIKYKKSKERNT